MKTPKIQPSKKLNIAQEVALIREIILKQGSVTKEELIEKIGIGAKTLDRRLEMLKGDKRYYLNARRGKPITLIPIQTKESKVKQNKKAAPLQGLVNRIYKPEFTTRIAAINNAINERHAILLKNYEANTEGGIKDRTVYPLKLIFSEIDVKLLAVPENRLDSINTYMVSRMTEIGKIRDNHTPENLTADNIKFDIFGMLYTDPKKLYTYTLRMNKFGRDMLIHDFPHLTDMVTKISKKKMETRIINGKTYSYEYQLVLKVIMWQPVCRFLMGMIDCFLVQCDKQDGIDNIRGYITNTIIPCSATQLGV